MEINIIVSTLNPNPEAAHKDHDYHDDENNFLLTYTKKFHPYQF